jgi:hypothetical protein
MADTLIERLEAAVDADRHTSTERSALLMEAAVRLRELEAALDVAIGVEFDAEDPF